MQGLVGVCLSASSRVLTALHCNTHVLNLALPGAQAASATGAARETAQEAVRRAENNLQAAKDKAKEVSSSAYQATKGKAHDTYEAGRDTAQQAAQAAVERAEAALQAARDKVRRNVAACLLCECSSSLDMHARVLIDL